MPHRHFLLPFRRNSKNRIISSTGITVFTLITLVFLLIEPRMKMETLGSQLLYLCSIYTISLIILCIFHASLLSTIGIVIPAFIIIFFLGFTSLFSQQGVVLLQIPIGSSTIELYSIGLHRAVQIWVRGLFSVSLVTLYATSVTIQEFIQSLHAMFFPDILVTMITLILRYTPLLFEQGSEIRTAQELRGLEITSFHNRFTAAAARVGGTLIRSTKKGTEVYEAMLIRGLDNSKHIRSPITRRWFDILFLFVMISVYGLIAGGLFYWIQ